MKIFSPAENYKSSKNIDKGFKKLAELIKKGDIKEIRILMKTQPELFDKKDYFGGSVLHIAVRKGKEEIVKLLLEFKPELIYFKDEIGWTPLNEAIFFQKLEVIKLLLNFKPSLIDVVTENGETVLHSAACWERIETVELLLKLNPNLLVSLDKEGKYAFHLAIIYRRSKSVKHLQDKIPIEDVINIFTEFEKTNFCKDIKEIAVIQHKNFQETFIKQSTALLAEIFPSSLSSIVQGYIMCAGAPVEESQTLSGQQADQPVLITLEN